MIMCGRCGQRPAGLGGYGSRFRIFERYGKNGEKLGIKTELCHQCQEQLFSWLKEGGYDENKGPALPVRSTSQDLMVLKNQIRELKAMVDSMVSSD